MSDGRVLLLVAALGWGALGLACSTRSGHAAAPVSGAAGAGGSARRSPDAGAAPRAKPPEKSPGQPDGGVALGAVPEGDCPAICSKLLGCKHGPWDSQADCLDACEGALEDEGASKTYRCAAKATSCAKLKRCGR